MKIIALHGFLGKNADWELYKNFPLIPIDPFILSPQHFLSLNEFGAKLNKEIEGNENVLLGYSMGGRLGLHALIQNPKKWKAAIIISTHTGLTNTTEKQERLKNDAKLLLEFQNDFDGHLKKWDKLPIFSKGSSFLRKKEDYTPFILKQCLHYWSLGHQENLKSSVEKLSLPILWIAGALDEKYAKLAKSMQFSHSKSKIWIATNTYHRVAWELKVNCEQQIQQFLGSL